MKILLHGRLESVIERCVDRCVQLNISVVVAKTLIDGLNAMRSQTFDKIFIGPGVTLEDRLCLIKCAGETHGGVVELDDRSALYRELHARSISARARKIW